VGVLELGRWDVAKTRVNPTVVVPIDPAGGRVFDVCDGLVGPVVEHGRADTFRFVEPVDGLHQRIIVCVTDGPNRGCDAIQGKFFGVRQRNILSAFNRSLQHLLVELTIVVH